MTLTLNQADWEELCHQAPLPPPSQLRLEVGEWYTAIPPCLGRGYQRGLELLPGVWLDWTERNHHRDCLLKIPIHDHLVQFLVPLTGALPHDDVYPTLNRQRSYVSGSGISPAYTVQYERSQPLVWVSIHLLPAVFAEFLAEMADCPEALAKLLLKQDDWKVSFFPTVTPALRQIAQRLLHAPFHGNTKRLYLQEAVWELLRLQLQPLLADQPLCQPAPGCKPDTIARIYHAREVLHSRLENPPELFHLAQQVGVSDRTLQRGFRDLFGTTVIGYLTQQRMKQAELLLRENHYTIAEVANRVGYSHLGHFAARFKRQFGMTPRECLAGRQSVG